MRSKYLILVVVSLLLAISLAACGGAAAPTQAPAAPTEAPTTAPEPTMAPEATEAPAATGALGGMKIALLTSGPINDDGWNQTAYEGLKALETEGAVIANTENVAQADQVDLIRNYAEQGFGIIIGHGFEYGDALTQAAAEFPDVKFIQIGGIAEHPGNLVSYVFQAGEGGYAAGILAGLMVKEGKLGGVGAMEIPTIAADFNAFKQAAMAVNPNVKDVPVSYTGSWVDIPKAKEAATAQIDGGVTLILANGDNANVGAIDAAKTKGDVWVIGWTRDQAHLAPGLVLTSNEQRVDNILTEAIAQIQAGTIEWKNHTVGFADKAQTFAPFAEVVPQDVQDEVNKVIQALVDGQIVLDAEGNVVTDTYHKGAPATGAASDLTGMKIALLTSGPINDDGWNQTAYEGLKALETEGAVIANTENVAQADQVDLIRNYAEQGFGIIIGHGFEYGDALTQAAAEFPDVKFIQIGGIAEHPGNLVSYVFQAGEGGYAAGILAGLMVKEGKLGGVGAMEIPTIAADFNAFKQAAMAVNPNVKDVPVSYTGSWVDIPKAKEAATAQIDGGVTLILANGDNANVGAIDAAKTKGDVWVIGWTRDQAHLAPGLVLTSNEQRVDNILTEAIAQIQAGTIEWKNHTVGFADKAQTFAPFAEVVPQDVQDEVNKVIQALVDGQIVLDADGNVVTDTYHN